MAHIFKKGYKQEDKWLKQISLWNAVARCKAVLGKWRQLLVLVYLITAAYASHT